MTDSGDLGAQNTASAEEQRKQALVSLGGKLRQLREAQKISYADVAQETKIQKHYVQAMEEGRIEDLPKGPFVRSFLRQYCSYLSADDMWPKYDELTQSQAVKVVLPESGSSASYVKKSPKVFKPEKHAWIYILFILLGILAVYLMVSNRAELTSNATSPLEGGTAAIAEKAQQPLPDPVPPAAVSEEKTEEPAPVLSPDTAVQPEVKSTDAAPVKAEEPAKPVEAKETSVDLGWLDGKEYKEPEPAPAPAVKEAEPAPEAKAPEAAKPEKKTAPLKNTEIKIIPKAVIWVKVSSGKTVHFQGLIKPGEDRIFEAAGETPLRVRYGNPGKTGIVWNGKTIESVGVGKTPVTRYYHADGSVTEN